MSVSATAQEVAETRDPGAADKIQSVVVTGYTSSIQKALANKLDAPSIMDSIVADDIGKLPDQNIAEAIARVPGVTVSQSHGEGQFITVRGMGPEFNTALLNGRVLATENRGREYSFDILPAELISGVDIIKSATADQIEGGIGSTVNMKTAKPLELGNKMIMSGQGNYDRQRGKVSPQASGLFSMKSDDGRFGALASFSYINRKIEGQKIFTDGWQPDQTLHVGTGGATTLSHVSMPTYVEYGLNDTTRERLSGLAAVQWKPTKDLLLTVDGLYSKLNVNDNNNVFFLWGGTDDVSAGAVDSHNTLTSYTGVHFEGVTTQIRPRLANTKEIGFNAKWTPSAQLSSVFDASFSKAKDNTGGNQAWFDSNLNAAGFDPSKVQFHISPNGLPVYTNLGNISDTSRATMGWLTWEGTSVVDKVNQASYNLKYKFGSSALKSVEFGVNYLDRTKENLSYKTPGSVQSLFTGIPLPSSLFTTSANAANFMGSGMFSTPFPGYTVYQLQSYLLSDAAINKTANPAATRAALAANGGNFGVQFVPGESGSAHEKNYGTFVQASFADKLGEHDWSGNIGLRYVNTREESKGIGQEILSITKVVDMDSIVRLSDPVPLTETGSYKEFLPSANFKLDVTNGLMFQAAVAKTMTRATLSDLLIHRNIDTRQFNINDGNPNLKPMLGWNYDAALTWYDDQARFLSVAAFYKDLTNLSKNETSTVQILGQNFYLNRPENVGTSNLKGVEVSGQYMFKTLPAPFDGLGVQANYTFVKPSDSADTKTYNLVGFYERGPIQFRVAYNYRNAYEASHSGNRGQPVDVAAFGECDASLSYALSKQLTFFAQAINLNNAKTKVYSIYPERVITYEAYGPRYALGARVTF
jgi:TonB-dependent receptor